MALERIKNTASALRTFYSNLSTPHKILFLGTIIAVLSSVGFVLYQVNKPDYVLLYSNIPEKEMASTVEQLKQAKIPYKIEENKIFVPRKDLYNARLTLAKAGLPKGGKGFEIFDEQKLGSTEFVQKVNYQRALQEELARTITHMEKIEEARVHLVLPEESLFVKDEKPPSASIVIKVKQGQQLSSSELQGIVNLVAGAVRGLTEENVTILSTDGQILFRKDPIQTSFQLSDLQLRYKQRIEEELQRKLHSMLAPVLGEKGVISRVNVDIDFSQVKVSEDIFDPDSATPRSQQRIIEKQQGPSKGPKGNPDVPINIESKLLVNNPPKTDDTSGQQSSERQEEIINYELNKTTRQVIYTPGTIKRLSVAVLVDGPYKEEKVQNVIKKTFVGRTPDEMKAIEDIVKKAVGYNDARGDQISVTNIPFTAEQIPPVPATQKWIALAKENYKIILNLLIVLALFFFVIRPLMKRLDKIIVEAKKLPKKPEEIAEAEAPKLISPREKSIMLVQQHPEKAAEIISSWIREEV